LWNVFKGYNGFHGCKLSASGGGKVVGFVNFDDRDSAVAAREAVNGTVFDHAHPGATLRVEFAKQNTKERLLTAPFSPAFDSGTTFQLSEVTATVPTTVATAPSSPVIRGTNPPCPTLFIGNVSDAATEEDLIEAFSGLDGYVRCRMGPQELTARRRVAFVDFKNTQYSTMAMAQMQGVHLPFEGSRAERKPIRIEYAKVRMNSKRPGGLCASQPMVPFFFDASQLEQ
jgi:RNA recognition motif-containing protein